MTPQSGQGHGKCIGSLYLLRSSRPILSSFFLMCECFSPSWRATAPYCLYFLFIWLPLGYGGMSPKCHQDHIFTYSPTYCVNGMHVLFPHSNLISCSLSLFDRSTFILSYFNLSALQWREALERPVHPTTFCVTRWEWGGWTKMEGKHEPHNMPRIGTGFLSHRARPALRRKNKTKSQILFL